MPDQDTVPETPAAEADAAFDLDAAVAAAAETVAKAQDTPADAPIEEQDTAETARARDAQGRFVKADETPTETPATEAKPAEQPGLEPPAAWSAAAKAAWATVPRDLQEEVLKRERDVAQGFEAKAKDAKRYEPLEQVIAPMRAKWQMRGMSEAQAIGSLIGAAELLENDPQRGFALLAQQFGVNLATLAQQPAAQIDPARAATDAALQPIVGELNALKQHMRSEADARAAADIAEFSKAHPHLETVRQTMGRLMQAGMADNLSAAYEKAVLLHPEIAQREQAAQRAADDKKRAEEAAAAAEKARRAAKINVSGRVAAAPAPAASIWETVDQVAAGLYRQ